MRSADLANLQAVDAVQRLACGELRAAEYADACLARTEERGGEIAAWQVIERQLVSGQAQAVDAHRQSGRPIGPLHGVPVAVQDAFDTFDLPCTNGTLIDAGRRPSRDAVSVARLRAAGAVILGRAATTELGVPGPGVARNPADRDRTAGGPGGGAAAVVASAMAPLAMAMQSAGAITWSASCCGVVGYKPSHGLVPRVGMLRHSVPLDTIGAIGRTVEDVALLVDVIAGHDPGDADTRPAAPPRLLELARSEPPLEPLFASVSQQGWARVDSSTAQGFAELAAELGERCDTVDLPDMFADGIGAHRALLLAGLAYNLRHYAERGGERIGEAAREVIEEGRRISATSYLSALDWREVLHAGLEQIFERYDVIVTPASAGEAPALEAPSGESAFCALWTLLGVPTVTVPLLEGPNGLPVGVQLVGRRGYDGRLLRTASWLCGFLAGIGHDGATADVKPARPMRRAGRSRT